MSDFRTAYIEYSERIQNIMREPTEQELVNCLPVFHQPKHLDGTPLTADEYRDLAKEGWRAKQVSEVIRIIAELKQPKPANEASLISMGMDLGVFAMSKLFATGKYTFSTKEWEAFGWNAAESLQRETGQPAEDLVLEMLPIVEAAIKAAGGKP